MTSSISIIVPLYHGENYISTIISMVVDNYIIAKKYFPITVQLIFVNDSPDTNISTENLQYEGINVLFKVNSCNEGIHKSRLNGLKSAIGEYVLFLDQDDIISDEFIFRQLSQIGDSDAIICNGYEHGMPIIENTTNFYKKLIEKKNIISIGKQIFPGQVVLRKNSIPIEWLNNIIVTNCSDDLYLWCLMLGQRKKFAILNNILYCHVATGENVSDKIENKIKSNSEVYYYLFQHGIIDQRDYDDLMRQNNEIYTFNDLYKRNLKHSEYTWILDAWMHHREQGFSISSWIQNKGISCIAIYGYGILGKHLMWELKKMSHIKIYIIDQNIKSKIDLPFVTIGEDIPFLDVIIVTPTYQYIEIKKDLYHYYKCEIISLATIISILPQIQLK